MENQAASEISSNNNNFNYWESFAFYHWNLNNILNEILTIYLLAFGKITQVLAFFCDNYKFEVISHNFVRKDHVTN